MVRMEVGGPGLWEGRTARKQWAPVVCNEETQIFGLEMRGEKEGTKFRKFHFSHNLI